MEYKYQTSADDFRVQYSITSLDDNTCKEELFMQELSDTYSEIDRLTNHADGYDYALAVSSGILAGIIDSFIVGEWDFARGKRLSNSEANIRIADFAKKHPDYMSFCNSTAGGAHKPPRDPDRLETAIAFLESKYPLPGDAPWLMTGYDGNGNVIDDKKLSPKSHHFDDLSHHPTIAGLAACIISQFTRTGLYVNEDNRLVRIPFSVDENGYIEGKTPVAKTGAGIINWCFNVARHRHGHLMSDIAGSKSTAGGGMGLPGTILSLLKELSYLTCFDDSEFPKKLSMAYENGIGTGKGQVDFGMFNCLFEGASSRFDSRTESAVMKELKRQAIPVAINEVVVRAFYFIRHFIAEMKDKGSLDKIDFKKIIPFNNRTIVRMITIAAGTFTAIDLADAAIRGAVKSGGNSIVFAKNFILRVNFVGVGRLTLALAVDVFMGARKGRLELAATCGEVAAAAIAEKKAIQETDNINRETDNMIINMKALSDNISSLKF